MGTHPAIRLSGLRKSFGAVEAVAGVDLDVADGEFFAMLGPSGSGKTTVLRLIAGFEQPTGGTVALGGRNVTGLAPHRRDVNTVFQDYALFPHLTVLENIEYGLKVRKVPKRDRRRRAEEALEQVRLPGFGGRRPGAMSGGQRQRVALARALVNRPRVLLLDEPLGALDRRLREQMQVELKALHREVGITFVFVTHDQDEALTMSDRVAVFDAGRIVQCGSPQQVYEHPATAFVAGFVGSSNVVTGPAARALFGRSGAFSVRPEKLILKEAGAPGTVAEVIYAGATTRYVVDLDAGARVVVARQNSGGGDAVHKGERTGVAWPDEHVIEIPSGEDENDALATDDRAVDPERPDADRVR
ncbi:ABC transporter ATP-binding protein [Symbioplanes lichenis]|uniref:ABC transporter ATP-binding protein n=1 Tax=Symbioplanes lichenis TaxID=1629072 RepID=UPI00273869ED|nr:ABC transporter ATP-binding protein [Actinoplanes lichenis]